MSDLTPEERKHIYEEEKVRLEEAKAQALQDPDLRRRIYEEEKAKESIAPPASPVPAINPPSPNNTQGCTGCCMGSVLVFVLIAIVIGSSAPKTSDNSSSTTTSYLADYKMPSERNSSSSPASASSSEDTSDTKRKEIYGALLKKDKQALSEAERKYSSSSNSLDTLKKVGEEHNRRVEIYNKQIQDKYHISEDQADHIVVEGTQKKW